MKYNLEFFYLFLALKFIKCGRLDPFITGGSFVGYNKYPHSVHISINCKQKFMCGGSILNQDLILTAAHCLEGCQKVKSNDIIIKYGHEQVTNMKSTSMSKFVQHQNYDEASLNNDIALISSKDSIPLNNAVKRVIIMKKPPKSEYAYIAGWGIDERSKLQSTLKHTNALIQKLDVCRSMGWLPKGVFCAGPITGLGAADQGDSGGALVIQNCIQIGIVSYKVEKYSLVAYTNVSVYVDWIMKNSKTLACAG